MIEYCTHFGFKFGKLEGLVAQSLAAPSEQTRLSGGELREAGPHRHADFPYVPADAERAFGDSVLSILSSEWCGNPEIERLCQAILSNEDAWIFRRRPRSIESSEEWPAESEYGSDKMDVATRRSHMVTAAKSASVAPGWTVFAARVQDFNWKEDFDLFYWYETVVDGLLISAPKVPMCPGGRSFAWWIGEPFEVATDRFVSGLFVGGRQRLTRSHFEIRPPKAWREDLGWMPNPVDPLEWVFEGTTVARFERLHGSLKDNPHGPHYRQPVIDRWVIKSNVFDALGKKYADLREREAFTIHQFKVD